MGFYKIDEKGFAKKVESEKINYEEQFEDWIENSPSLLYDDENQKAVLWIGRQAVADVGDNKKFPDMIGLDADGDLVIVELKKGRTPREVIAQVLEYASWGHTLSYAELNSLYVQYNKGTDNTLLIDFNNEFEQDVSEDYFNKKQKLFVIAEEISSTIKQVSKYLGDVYKMDINHLEYQVMRRDNEIFLSVEKTFGYTKPILIQLESTERWSGDNIGKLVFEGVKTVIKNDPNKIFTQKEIREFMIDKYPAMKQNTVSCSIMANCVNHTSRKHYSNQDDFYFQTEKGKYRLYDQSRDGKWNAQGQRIS